MPSIFNVNKLKLERNISKIPDFAWLSSPPLAEIAKSKNLHFDVRSLLPGKFSYPYHFHRNAEELFVILEGEATLRSPDGFKEIVKGDLLFFEEGPAGAHQLYNHSDSPCVYLDIRTINGIDVCEYPDSGKINILPFMEIFSASSRVRYYSGEDKVRDKWPAELVKKNQQRSRIDRYIQAYNTFDIDGMLAEVHAEIVFENVAGGEINATATGKAELRRLAEHSKGLFESRRLTVTRIADQGDQIFIDVDFSAVLAVDLPNGKRKGETLDLAGRTEFSFRDGLISKIVDIS